MLPLYLAIVVGVGASIQAQKQMECFEIFGRNTCPDGYQCRGGQCEPDYGQPLWCSWMMPCGPNHECIEGLCVPDTGRCQTNRECNLNERCTFGICIPDESNERQPEVVACRFHDRIVSFDEVIEGTNID